MPDPPSVDRSDRLRRLLDMLAERGRLSVTEAATALAVSEATVRRDFGSLAQQQLVTRTHGGVVGTAIAYDLPVRYRNGDASGAKERIARAASELITIGQVVGFNGGTTTSATARRLASRTDLAEATAHPSLTIVTNALNIAGELVLRPHIRAVSLGGVARPKSYELVGPLPMLVLEELWLDHLFLGADGVTTDNGVSCHHEGEAAINARMVERAAEVTVVAGGEKLGRTTFARICPISALTRLVTDDSADPSVLDGLRDEGVEVVVV